MTTSGGYSAGEFTAGCADTAHRDEKNHLLSQWVEMLSPREMEVLNGRFGLHNGESEVAEVLGDRLGISVERVHHLRRVAVAKLKQHRARNGVFKDEVS